MGNLNPRTHSRLCGIARGSNPPPTASNAQSSSWALNWPLQQRMQQGLASAKLKQTLPIRAHWLVSSWHQKSGATARPSDRASAYSQLHIPAVCVNRNAQCRIALLTAGQSQRLLEGQVPWCLPRQHLHYCRKTSQPRPSFPARRNGNQ